VRSSQGDIKLDIPRDRDGQFEPELIRKHQNDIRNSLKCVSHKDRKEFSSDMKFIYKAPTEESALKYLDEFETKWGKEYPLAVGVWSRNWERISAMYRFTEEIRKLIYTTICLPSPRKLLYMKPFIYLPRAFSFCAKKCPISITVQRLLQQ
jgi:transposase-like protein